MEFMDGILAERRTGCLDILCETDFGTQQPGLRRANARQNPGWAPACGMRILIVGGTVFVGRALTDAALARGHHVTLLNRGKSAASIPAGVEHLAADRNADLTLLRGKDWDAVIDTCAYYPRQVQMLLAALAGSPHYTLISSISAYADHSRPGLTEASALAEPLFGEEGPITAANYGRLKAACEQVANEAAGSRSLVVRPGIIIGPHDPTGRFGHWIRCLAAGEKFVAPGDGADPLQVIDVNDLAAWTVRLVEQRRVDVFNAVGPTEPLVFRDLLNTGRHALHSSAEPVWVKREIMESENPGGRVKLPLWIPRTDEKSGGVFAVDGRKAWAAGLTLRPLAESIVDCARYEATLTKPNLPGVSPGEEKDLLQRIIARAGS
jgi:2'-hydroxyisoflavone reductase